MTTKKDSFNGKAIYNPAGKAGEYSRWACNFYLGCSNDCSYCYCKKGFIGRLWQNRPQLKKCFADTEDAFRIYVSELKRNLAALRQDGLFFTFTSDPMLPEALPLTVRCLQEAVTAGVPVQVLTKKAVRAAEVQTWGGWVHEHKPLLAFGFTLTGRDDLEPGADSNAARMEAMRSLRQAGFHTFASIEPVVQPEASMACIRATADCCDLFKVGLMSGKKDYNPVELASMVDEMQRLHRQHGCLFYLKDSLVSFLGIDRTTLGQAFVPAGYHLFGEPLPVNR